MTSFARICELDETFVMAFRVRETRFSLEVVSLLKKLNSFIDRYEKLQFYFISFGYGLWCNISEYEIVSAGKCEKLLEKPVWLKKSPAKQAAKD